MGLASRRRPTGQLDQFRLAHSIQAARVARMIHGLRQQPLHHALPHPRLAGPHHGLGNNRQGGRGDHIQFCQSERPLVHPQPDLGPLAGKGLARAGLHQPLQFLALVE